MAILTLPLSTLLKFWPEVMSLANIQADPIPFLHRTTWVFCIDVLLMIVVSLSDATDRTTQKSIIVDKQMFRVSPSFVIGSVGIFGILAVLYTVFLVKSMQKIVLAGLLLMSTLAMAQLPQRLDSFMRATTQPDQPGTALLLMINNKVIYRNGLGLANAETNRPITPETNFRMASVSKQFTAMGILLLEKEGKLSLNDPLGKFFPELSPRVGTKVLLRHLLTHASGILDYESVMNPNQREQLLDADVLSLLNDKDSLYFEPGTKFRYSNSAYCLLALLIERVSGQPFAAFIQRRIFQPLQINHSAVYQAGKPIANRAMGYRQKDDAFGFADQSVTSATKGDGGVYTSLDDYQKWNKALQSNRLLDIQAALARAGYAIPQAPGNYYADGWFFRDMAKPILFHSGSTCGFNNYVVSIPSKQFLMVYFSNRADNKANVEKLVRLLADAGYSEPAAILHLDDLTQ